MEYPYDYFSVTHYENKDFSKNGDNTLEAIDDPEKILGNHLGLSKTDVRKINDAYKCNIRTKTGKATALYILLFIFCNLVSKSFCKLEPPNKPDRKSIVESTNQVAFFSISKSP